MITTQACVGMCTHGTSLVQIAGFLSVFACHAVTVSMPGSTVRRFQTEKMV
jgi:hypothetical protein